MNLHAYWDALLGTDSSYPNLVKVADKVNAEPGRADVATAAITGESHARCVGEGKFRAGREICVS